MATSESEAIPVVPTTFTPGPPPGLAPSQAEGEDRLAPTVQGGIVWTNTGKFKYDNVTLGPPPALLRLRGGKVSFQGRYHQTPYHGNYRYEPASSWLIIMFDCLGREHELKSVVLERKDRFVWEGLDYRFRRIIMTDLPSR